MTHKIWFWGILLLGFVFLFEGCKKSQPDSSNLYTPNENDVTPNASLDELKQGRAIYINKCGECHNYYTPESFSANEWVNILNTMAPRANLSETDRELVTKYVTKGQL